MELQYNGLENSRIYLSGDFSRDVEAATVCKFVSNNNHLMQGVIKSHQ